MQGDLVVRGDEGDQVQAIEGVTLVAPGAASGGPGDEDEQQYWDRGGARWGLPAG